MFGLVIITMVALVAFPTLCLVAAVAVLFECVPVLRGGDVNIGAEEMSGKPVLFPWPEMRWTARMILCRLLWVAVAALLALTAAPFARFDPARGRPHRRPQTRDRSPSPTPSSPEPTGAVARASLTPLVAGRFRPRLGYLVLAELRLMLRGYRWWWVIVVTGRNIAGLVATSDTARQYLLAAAWLRPILLWQSMGSREQRHNTRQMAFAAAHPLRRQFPAVWLAGVCVAALTGIGLGVQRLLAGQWHGLAAWAVGVVFIPSLVLALGTWSGSSRLFEITYLLLWYVGPMNQVPALDYMGVTRQAVAGGIWRGTCWHQGHCWAWRRLAGGNRPDCRRNHAPREGGRNCQHVRSVVTRTRG